MSARRKDMWILLYNLVQQKSELNEVFVFVHDILCKEPSLIKPFSSRELNNRFQETFIFWLLNKFVKALGEEQWSEDTHLKNVNLQQKILASCLINRTVLFKRLVVAYALAIEELSVQVDDDDDEGEELPADEAYLTVTAFTLRDVCMQEIDANFNFQEIRVYFDDVDARIQGLLHVLQYALSIGYEVSPQVFVDGLRGIFHAIKECGFTTKIMCLRYCHSLFERSCECSVAIEYYYKLALRALLIMWEQLPMWLHTGCVQPKEIDNLFDVVCDVMRIKSSMVKQLRNKHELLQLTFGILTTLVDVTKFTLSTGKHQSLNDTAKCLVDFMMKLHLQDGKGVTLNEKQVEVLLSMMNDDFAVVIRLVAMSVLHRKEDQGVVLYAMQRIKERLLDYLQRDFLSTGEVFATEELLRALIFMEHHNSHRAQLIHLKAMNSLESLTKQNFRCELDLFAKIIDSNWCSLFNTAIENYIERSCNENNPERKLAAVRIVELLFQCITIRNVLEFKAKQSAIRFLESLLAKLDSAIGLSASGKEEDLACAALQALCHITIGDTTTNDTISLLKHPLYNIGRKLFSKTNDDNRKTDLFNKLQSLYANNLCNLLLSGIITKEYIIQEIITFGNIAANQLATILQSIYCTSGSLTCYIFMLPPYGYSRNDRDHITQFICVKCSNKCQSYKDFLAYVADNFIVSLQWTDCFVKIVNSVIPEVPAHIRCNFAQALLKKENCSLLGNHLELSKVSAADCLQVLCSTDDISTLNTGIFPIVLSQFANVDDHFIYEIAKFILQHVAKSLNTPTEHHHGQQQQLQLLQLIKCCAHSKLTDQWLFHFFKITFFYLVHPNSQVVHEAVLCAMEMCGKHDLQPIQLWNWYKHDALSLIVKLAIFVYLNKGVRLTRSLKAFTKMLGFSCVQEFICKYYRLLTTMILPYCVKEPQCKGLIVSIAKITRKPISALFVVSFLRIYTHIYLTEDADVGNKCIDLIVQCTGCSLQKLMNTDVKQTVSEFLIYFNRNPKFVMKAFQCLLLQDMNVADTQTSSKALMDSTQSSEFAKFIADRFLGVITYFETCLAEPNFEKPLKEEALYSLGQIIRFVGAQHVTQFRFKIIAMLSFVLSLNDRHLQNICLKIWNIFLHIVNIEELGPSLSRIVASLQPLLKFNPAEVNAIYEFVILNNDSLLGAYIPDLYFVEDIESVAPSVRQLVARQTEMMKGDKSPILDKVAFLHKQITNENLQVRIYGLAHLRRFIAAHRIDINHMVLSEIRIDPIIESVVDILIAGCRHENRHLQLESAKCLGELGAIDPSYMPSNYFFEQSSELPLSIHTDSFAIKALTELCRAYQFQKDTKYVDSFSLAIQETLSVCGISPKENKKLNVWEALPLRMRHIMEPLLNSCYTGSRRETKCKEHPIFNSSFCRSYEEWAFTWASRLIDYVRAEDTKHLLNSYKPSIKRDNNTLAIFFPYILLHALIDCSEQQMQQIYEECDAVFAFSTSGLVAQPEYEASGAKEFLSTKYSADRTKKPHSAEQYDALENIIRTCIKFCSEQVDFLHRWERQWQRIHMGHGKGKDAGENYKRVQCFLAKFDKLLIAKANYYSGEYVRALRYLEEYIEAADTKVRMQEQISFLIEIHGQLTDADSVVGAVYMKKSNLNLYEEILVNRIVDRPQETMSCYEQLMSSDEQIHQDHIKGMINCYLRMDTPETALLITDGLWQKLTDQYTDDYFKECKSELLWRLGRYDELQELLEDSVVKRKTTNWNIQCAEAFLLFRQSPANFENEIEHITEQLDNIRSNVLCTMRTCSGVKQNLYPHSYEEVVKLHLLNEVEKNKLLLNVVRNYLTDSDNEVNTRACCVEKVKTFFADWDARLNVIQPIVRVMEPILCFRRNLLIETKRLLFQNSSSASSVRDEIGDWIDMEIGKLWIRSVQMNREAGSLQQAHISIMKAEQYAPKTLFIEKAKLLWEKGDQTNAFKLIEENLERIESKCQRNIRALEPIDRALFAEAKYLQATYNAESMNICSELNLRYFKEAISGNRLSEKCHVQLAQYMEKIYDSFSRDQKYGENGCKVLIDVMLNYAKSLRYGFDNVYQSLPRLLSIWLDYTSQCATLSSDSTSSDQSAVNKLSCLKECGRKMNDVIANCTSMLPIGIFYTAFSQLLSRICHPSVDVYNVLRNIVIKLVEHYPHQSLWMLLPVFKSSYTNRIKRCRLIFTDSRLAKPSFQKLLNDFNMLAERLIELTNKEVLPDQTFELSTLVRQLPRLFDDPKFSNILLPFEKYMQASFPISSTSSAVNLNLPATSQENANTPSPVLHNPFPYSQIYITGIKETVTVLRSAARPKKISIQCSDGKEYAVMVKPKDNLRKDFRLMEFNGLVKRYLHQDSQARHRRLRIRTYAAIPFNEECGLVEWLPNLNSFRNICVTIYRTRGLGILDRMLRQCAVPKTDPIEKKRDMFLNKLLPYHPPVFHEWFRQRFSTPHSWYEARSSYVKTVAVMSMVGYILGLGDRHGENVLFDETNGDAVHVDFNCLFNQGETFAYPELVPFRLTHNMVFAMGPLGVEGMFRRCCEITLRVLKQQSKTLMSVLRPFVYDLEVLSRGANKKQTSAEVTDPKAMMDVRRIEERLQGYVKKTLANSMPLSIEGQVNFLIAESTNIDNLAAMYIGWGSYI